MMKRREVQEMYDKILQIIATAVDNDTADIDSAGRLFALAILNEE